jgi:hypothetical protein
MNKLKAFFDKYPQESRLWGLVAMGLCCYFLVLQLLSLPLRSQQVHILQQEKHLKLANLLPPNWQTTINALDATDLIGQLSKKWQDLMKNQDLQFAQVNRQQLKLKINAYDEQSFLHWLWGMQSQYAFKVEQMQMHPTPGKIGLIDAEFLLQVI